MRHLLVLAAVLAASCASQPATAPVVNTYAGQRELELFASFLSGTFETIAQPEREGSSSPVTMRNAPIWPDAKGERWIYSEYQRRGEAQPFRQIVYRLHEGRAGVLADVYELPPPAARFAGAGRTPKPLAELSPRDLLPRPGCQASFLRQGEIPVYNGGTAGTECRIGTGATAFEVPDFYITSSSIRHSITRYEAPGRPVPGQPGPWEFRKNSEKIL
jgi:hypothetical protein